MTRSRTSYGRYLIPLLLLLFTGIPGCRNPPAGDPVLPEWQSVIFFTIDTLNPHYLGCYGDPVTRSYLMDSLARNGVLFSDCHTAINLTGPSFSTLNTGVPPYVHEVYDNALPIADEHTTLAEVFQNSGFNTMAAVSAFHLNPEQSNFGQGFNTFFRCSEIQIDTAVTTDRVLQWAVNTLNQKRFAWIHYMDCHAAYEPPEPFLGMYFKWDQPKPHVGKLLARPLSKKPGHKENGTPMKPALPENELINKPFLVREPFNKWYAPWLRRLNTLDDAVAHYRGTITEVDYQMERICRQISETGQWNHTLIIVTADHGESFGEHEIYFDHWGPYEPGFDIPLIFSGKLQPQINTGMAGSVDIPKTLLALSGLPIPEAYQGYSLKNAVLLGDPSPRKYLVTEHSRKVAVSIRDADNKLIVPLAPEVFYPRQKELYQYQRDLSETTNHYTETSEIQQKLMEKMVDYFQALTPMPAKDVSSEVAPEVRDQLEALGYFE